MNVQTAGTSLQNVLEDLEHEEQLRSLQYVVDKLPEFTKAIQSLEEPILFISNILQDKETLNNVTRNAEEKWDQLHIGTEHFDAIVKMVQMLPRIIPVLEKIEEFAVFTQHVLSDSQSMNYLIKGIEETPPISVGLEVINETNERFSKQQKFDNISIFRLLKLLKDPTIKKSFRYVELMLQVTNDKYNK